MSKLVALATLQFEVPPTPSKDLGKRGELRWIPLSRLMVDETYQRPIEAAGKKNIRRIIEEFHWTKFGPLIVSPRHGGVYAIIDGQHHAVAAALHGGVPEVPCWVLDCTPEEEARAFSTINGIVTRVHPQYLFRARIDSGDAGAVAADEAACAAGARIMPYPQASHQLKVGETLAGRTIELALGRYGREAVVTAMELITRTGDGNPGMLRADLIDGFAECLFTHPKWLANKTGIRLSVEARGLRTIYADAMKACASLTWRTIKSQVSSGLAELLHERHGDGGKASTPQKTLGVQVREQARREHDQQSRPTRPPAPPAEPPQPQHAPLAASTAQPEAKKHYPAVIRRPMPIFAPTSNEQERVGVDLDHQGKFKITTYLLRKGHMATAQGVGYRIDGRYHDLDEALEVVNRHRAKADLPDLKRGGVV
jgi:hypothetical protein